MVCLYCNTKLEVTNSRHQRRSNQIWRRRACPNCGALFTTHEKIELGNSLAVQNSRNKLKPFDRDRLFISIYKSCGHRLHALRDSAALTDTIIAHLSKRSTDGIINKSEIIDASISILQNFDKAAVVQYQAYHPAAKNS